LVELFNEVLGRHVQVPEQPRRIVSFSPAATETLFQIGAGGRIVGVSAFCARPPEARGKRRVGSYNTVRPELLDELAPDLIITVTGYQRDFAIGLSSKYPVYPLELPVSVAGIVDFVVKVGLIVGAPDAARDLAGSLLHQLARVKKVGGARVYVELDLGGPVTFGAHSYITDAFRLVGCSSIFEGERAEWLKPDLRKVVDDDPDAIVYEPKMYSKFGAPDLERLLASRRWEELRAVRTGKCFLTPGPLDFLAHHGPSFITEAIPWLEEKLASGGGRRVTRKGGD
jgi:ABC-type Fe3+-hydroxamate transport system substrate-binding protein